MELTGKIIAVLPERGGTSSRTGSEWKLAQYVLETMDQYPRKMVFEVFGSERIAQFNIQANEVMTVFFDIDAREYQGRWFNSIRAFRVDRNTQAVPTAAPMPDTTPVPGSPMPSAAPAAPAAGPAVPPMPTAAPFESNDTDDLPF